MSFVRWLNRGNFTLSSNSFKINDLSKEWKLAINAKYLPSISKIMPARPKKHRLYNYKPCNDTFKT